jgi:hypothetical protein
MIRGIGFHSDPNYSRPKPGIGFHGGPLETGTLAISSVTRFSANEFAPTPEIHPRT